MNFEEEKKIMEENLPQEIEGFERRYAIFPGLSIIMYSKDADLIFKYFPGNVPDIELFDKNLLFEASGQNFNEAFRRIKEKIDLNEKLKSDFPTNIIIGFRPNFKYINGTSVTFMKLFEVYLVLDTNSDSQFFSIVTINPLFDLQYILPVINDLKYQIKEKNLIGLSGEDFDYAEFNLPTTLHLYSYDFNQKKDDIRDFFKKVGWNVKFKDKYHFERQKSITEKKTILCEGKNFKLLNNLKFSNVVFSDEHNSISIFQNIKTRERYCLRDKDYLIDEEIIRLQKKFPKYYILKYYCIENYLYHPDNIDELNLSNFNKKEYIEDIRNNKNISFLEIVSNFKGIRKGYKELTENHFKNVNVADHILIQELKSDEFETFYKHFDMKTKYKKGYLSSYNLNDYKLANTNWFKLKISNLIA